MKLWRRGSGVRLDLPSDETWEHGYHGLPLQERNSEFMSEKIQ